MNLIPALLYREFFTPIVNGYLLRFGLLLLLWGTGWLLRKQRTVAEQYGSGLVMLGLLRMEEVATLRAAHKMGMWLYFFALAAAGWLGWYGYDQSQAKTVVPDNPLKDARTAPANPLDPGKFANPLKPGKPGVRGKPGQPGSPFAPMPPRR